ncbi:MAG: methyltransferase [Hyphomicrobium aestuarii]|nr:methyltransferase [Hyphomicrobium aestuarii]
MNTVAAVTTTADAFLGGRLTVAQLQKGYRAGIDAVLLAATVTERAIAPLRVLDVGSGVGTIGLLVATRIATAQVVLLERAPALAEIAKANCAANCLNARVRVVRSDIRVATSDLSAAGLVADSFDDVLANPPYHDEARGTAAPDPVKAASHAMPNSDLDMWVRFLVRMSKPGGCATMVHKAEALDRVLAAFAGRFGAIHVLPIHPRVGAVANRIIVRGTKGSRAPLVLLPGLVLHGDGNAFRPEVVAILRDGAALSLERTPTL